MHVQTALFKGTLLSIPCSCTILHWLGNITHRGSNSEVHLHTPQQKVPFSLIRCSSSNAKGTYCSRVAWGLCIYNIVESESDPLTRRPVDLFEKEPLKVNSEVHLHTPTKFGEDPSKDLGGDREHTHKRCSNYSMIVLPVLYHGCSIVFQLTVTTWFFPFIKCYIWQPIFVIYFYIRGHKVYWDWR